MDEAPTEPKVFVRAEHEHWIVEESFSNGGSCRSHYYSREAAEREHGPLKWDGALARKNEERPA